MVINEWKSWYDIVMNMAFTGLYMYASDSLNGIVTYEI